MDELIEVLRRERALLEELVYRLAAQLGILLTGQAKYLTRASSEVDELTERIRRSEAERARCVTRLAEASGIPAGEVTLGRLVAFAPEPQRSTLAGLQHDFIVLTDEIERTGSQNRAAVHHALQEFRSLIGDQLGRPAPELTVYTPTAELRSTTASTGIEGRL